MQRCMEAGRRDDVAGYARAVLFVGALLLWIAPSHAQAAAAGRSGRIVYLCRDGYDLCTIRSDGGDRSVVTRRTKILPGIAAWGPRARRISFGCGSTTAWSQHLCVMSSEGRHLRKITSSGGGDWAPAWSPSGNKIVWGEANGRGLRIIRANGTRFRVLTHGHGGAEPSWSARGGIVYSGSRGGILRIDPDGSPRRRLTNRWGHHFHTDSAPEWAPDARHIVFNRTLGIEHDCIFVMRADGTHVRRLRTPSIPGDDVGPSWSPNGRRILFAGNGDLYSMRLDGSHVRRVTNGGSADGYPDWSDPPSRRRLIGRKSLHSDDKRPFGHGGSGSA